MKNILKRSLSILLAITIIFSSAYIGLNEIDFSGLFAVRARAESSGTCGDNLTWTLDDEGILTISGTAVMTDFSSSLSAPWYSARENITSVVILEGVTSIGELAFSDCSSLISITIPDSVISIGSFAFSDCINLMSISISDKVREIGYDAFRNCTSLKSVHITDLLAWLSISFPIYTSNPLYYAKTLYIKGRLATDIVIPNGVTRIDDYAFYNCMCLTSVTISDSVKRIGSNAFCNCENITSVIIPSGVTVIGNSAFGNCKSLVSITIPGSVTSIGDYAFSNCTSLTEITIDYGVTSIGVYTFRGCSSLKEITIPDTVTSIANDAFRGCISLTSVIIGDSVKGMGSYTFFGCTGITSVTFGDSVEYIRKRDFSGCTSLTSIVIPDSVTTIDGYAFESCTSLTSVLIPESVTRIGTGAFYGCTNLTIYGVKSSYAETYANLNNIPFKDISEFGHVNLHVLSAGGTMFQLYNKTKWLDHDDVFNLIKEDKNATIENATVEYNGKKEKLSEYTKYITQNNLTGEIVFTAPDFYKYIIPEAVVVSIKENFVNPYSVFITKDRKDNKPYISTVFGRIHDEDGENQYTELQTNSLNVLKDTKYDVIVTADLKGEESATYYLSQDINHRIESETGVFSAVEIYSKFDANKPAYAYAVTSSGKVTEPVSIGLEKIVCSEAATALLSASKVNLLGSNTTGITISDSIPIIGGTELSLSLVELPVGVEIEGERVRVSIGKTFYKGSKSGKEKETEWISFKECCKEIEKEMKSGKDVKDKYNAFEKAKKERGFGNDNIKTTKKAGLSWDASYMGYIEGYFIDGNIVFTDFCGSVAASFIAQYTVNGSIGPVPAYFYVKGGVNGAFSLNLARKLPDKNVPFQFDATLSLTPNARIGGGVGTKGVASAGIYGSLSIPTILEIMDKHLTMSITAAVGVEGEILFWSGEKELASGTWNVLDKYFGSSKALMGNFAKSVYYEMAELMNSKNPDNSGVTYSLVSRDYASSTSGWMPLTTQKNRSRAATYGVDNVSNTNVTELQTSVYKNSQTQFVQFGDKVMLAYIEDCTERNTFNRYRLMYTMYNPSTNTWTQPKAVCDSGKMDISPSLATDGENIYIAWQTVNTNPTDVTDEELHNALNSVEIYSARYDSVSDSFVNVTQHTSNNTYDYSPYVTVENGSVTVYWVNAESLNYDAGEMSIHSSADSSNTLIYDNLNYVSTVKASGSEISYSMDVDGNLNTVNDIKLFTNGVQVGEDVVYDTAVVTNFTYGDFNGTETLFYSDGGTVYYIENGESVVAFSDDGGIADSLLITNLNGNSAVIYAQLTDMGSELCISIYENDVWSKPVTLMDIGCLLSNVDVVSVDGKVYAVFDRTQTTEATDVETGETYLEYGQTDLCMLASEGYYDLEISNIGYDEGDISIGNSAPFIVVMENKGTETIKSVNFVVSDSLGFSKTITKTVNLAPGAIESIELEYIAQEGYSACDLTVTATIVDCEDINTINNITTEQIGRTDIAVGAISTERIGDIYKINCEVKNDSLIGAENVCANVSFGIYKKEVAIGTMTANSSYIVELLVAKNELEFDENNVCTLTFSTSTTSEEIVLGNNENTVTVDNSEKLVAHEHNFVGNVCDGCGMNEYVYEISSEGVTITEANVVASEYTIPNSIDGASVTAIGASAFAGNECIVSVIIPESVTSIGEGAFANCANLKTIDFSGGIETIGENAFAGCVSLEYVVFSQTGIKDISTYFSFSDATLTSTNSSIFVGTGVLITVSDIEFTMEFECVVRNDINGDGVCDVLDCAQVALVINGLTTLDGVYAKAADSNFDEVIDVYDYQSIVNTCLSS